MLGGKRFNPPKAYRDACKIQRAIMLDMTTKLSPRERAELVKAWDTLEERKRILRGTPLPKPADMSKLRKQAAPAASNFVE